MLKIKGIFALAGMVAACSAIAANKPNPIEGGYTYYYGTPLGNTPDNPDNVNGRLPMSLHDFTPVWGTTNTMYLTCEDEFWLAADCKYTGIDNYNEVQKGFGALDGWNYCLSYDGRPNGECCYFYTSPKLVAEPTGSSRWADLELYNCHFISDDGRRAVVQAHFIGRSDAYYRTPRSDTYYVVPNTKLWFYRYYSERDGNWESPWLRDDGQPLGTGSYTGKDWSYEYDTWYDKFTISPNAQVGDTIYLRSQNDCRIVTVHVVSETFKFETMRVRYNVTEPGGTETRTLRQILGAKGHPIPECGINTVKSSDHRVTCEEIKGGDCELTAHGPFADDCEVTVTFNDGNVLLLRIVSMPGKISQASCSSKMPPLVTADFKNLLTDASGKLRTGLVWEDYQSKNAPVGYDYVKRTPSCIYCKGAFYTPCIAGVKKIEIQEGTSGPEGQLQCFASNQKLVGWLEDADGRKVINPSICFGNSGFLNRLYWRFGDGPDCTIYNNCDPVSLDPYVGTRVDDKVVGHFQGMLADEYGYFTFFLPANSSEGGQAWDEFAVFLVSDSKEIRVRKTVEGRGGEDLTFDFQAVYGDLNGKIVTNFFNVGRFNDWEYVFMAGTNAPVTVTELSTGKFTTTVRRLPDGPISSQTISDDGRIDNSAFEFVNTMRPDKVQLWITDHIDIGGGKMHLAFDPGLGTDPNVVGAWAEYVRENNMVLCCSATNEAELATAPLEPVLGFRDGHGTNDAAKGWVWVTVDVSRAFPVDLRLWKVCVSDTPCYCDELIRSAAAVSDVRKTALPTLGLYAYEFYGVKNGIALNTRVPATLTRILMVGGGGAGGGVIGGGGGGGQVWNDDSVAKEVNPSDSVFVTVGAGGLPPAQEPAYGPNALVWTENGGNGQASSVTIGDETYLALGGGGGGSFQSIQPVSDEGASGGGAAGFITNGGQPKDSAVGHAGGNSYETVPGGGGGAGSPGANGNTNPGCAGKGGEGTVCRLNGDEIFGSGGGGGGGNATNPAEGGTHGGAGGTKAGDDTSFGRPGEDGYGAGGGGGGFGANNLGYPGGRGGNGKVVLIFQLPNDK